MRGTMFNELHIEHKLIIPGIPWNNEKHNAVTEVIKSGFTIILVFTVMTTCLIRRSGIRTFFSSFYGKILGALFKQYFYVGSEIEIPASNAQKI